MNRQEVTEQILAVLKVLANNFEDIDPDEYVGPALAKAVIKAIDEIESNMPAPEDEDSDDVPSREGFTFGFRG